MEAAEHKGYKIEIRASRFEETRWRTDVRIRDGPSSCRPIRASRTRPTPNSTRSRWRYSGSRTMADHDARRALLVAALGFARLELRPAPPFDAMKGWLGSWPGIGAIATGMALQGYDVRLTKYAEQGWRATFYADTFAHSVVAGTAWERTPWGAVQKAAWEAVKSSPL